jgi:hypothetical protein
MRVSAYIQIYMCVCVMRCMRHVVTRMNGSQLIPHNMHAPTIYDTTHTLSNSHALTNALHPSMGVRWHLLAFRHVCMCVSESVCVCRATISLVCMSVYAII